MAGITRDRATGLIDSKSTFGDSTIEDLLAEIKKDSTTDDLLYQILIELRLAKGLVNETIDSFRFQVENIQGNKPKWYMDEFNIQETGTPIEYFARSVIDERFVATGFRFNMADALAGTVANGTMPGLSYDQILGVSALTNGILVQRFTNGEVSFSATLRQLSDFMSNGGNLINQMSDGTNTFITIDTQFPLPLIIEGSPTLNFVCITISDDLSGLLLFNSSILGAIETTPN